MPATNRRLRPGPSSLDDRIYRFLRPGALARLRDSRITARAQRSAAAATSVKVHMDYILPLLPPSSPSPPLDQIDRPPCFAVRIYGPQYPQRKKLAASKSFSFPPSSEVDDQILDFFGGADFVAAH
ncbi:hypothetical protein IHE45_08G145600 [Dioscorea alata]|uniref:Uncharacterized protein n=1 Tax=Dioscorea alata TaxID=55571 RepID=A0ACB7VNG0_DIOAL|nr:hypothetical protein IHE45_08G145600 [Dioscorea alata]